MSANLDRKKPFGEVSGPNAPHRYEQDGKYFDNEGKEIVAAKAATKKSAAADAPAGDASLEDLDLSALKEKATSMEIRFHPQTGAAKLRLMILAATPPAEAPKTGAESQVDVQLAG